MEIRYAHKLCSVRIQSKFLRIEWNQWPDCYIRTRQSVLMLFIDGTNVT